MKKPFFQPPGPPSSTEQKQAGREEGLHLTLVKGEKVAGCKQSRGGTTAGVLIACSTSPARSQLEYSYAKKLGVLPIGLIEQPVSNLLTLACSEKLNAGEKRELIESLEFATGERIRLVPVPEDELSNAIFSAYFGDDVLLIESARLLDKAPVSRKDSEGRPGGIGHDFIYQLIGYGLSKGASDIHLIPTEPGTSIRMRINGTLRESTEVVCSLNQHLELARCIKIRARLNTIDCSIPQDSSFRINIEEQSVAVRVSLMPTIHGERIVLRLLQNGLRCSLQNFGYSTATRVALEECLELREGMIIFCGPTGSGKTTALYAAMEVLSGKGLQLSSVEDPIEIDLPWLTQTELDVDAGLDYVAALKALLRQDPDVIMMGEIRDQSSASIAVNAALTGHMLLTTLHAGSVDEALLRFKELSTASVDISRVVKMIIVQHLLPDLCRDCSVYDLKGSRIAGAETRRAVGCSGCEYTGYRGRVVVEESLRVTPAVLRQFTEPDIKWQQGYVSAASGAWEALRGGRITVEDFARLTAKVNLR